MVDRHDSQKATIHNDAWSTPDYRDARPEASDGDN